jgi:phospholipase C
VQLDRRRFLLGALAGSGAAIVAPSLSRLAPATASGPAGDLPDPGQAGIEHVVVVMMENRSFDHFLGWLPGANGVQDTTTLKYPDANGMLHANYHLAEPMGCAHPDPDHSYEGGRFQLDGGAADNFARGNNDIYAIGFYTETDRPFMSALARNYTTCDNTFCSILAETYPNRFFMHSAQTDRLHNNFNVSTVPTIWDSLNQPGGPTGRYYFSDLPFLGLWAQKYLSISSPFARFLADAAAGTLPNVSFVDPRFEDEGSGTSGDDHPHAHIGAGDAFLSQIFQAVTKGPGWESTVLVVTYDEWGGFYDHVLPPRVTPGVAIGASASSGLDQDLVNDQVLLGFRVPCIIASPFSKGSDPNTPRLSSDLYDHTSILKLIQWRWGLPPLTQRDASTLATDPGNLATALDFSSPDASVPSCIPTPRPPVAIPCLPVAVPEPPSGSTAWEGLRASGLLRGWSV